MFFKEVFLSVIPRGVVQLFNAVRKHQNLVNEKVKEVGGSDRKKAKLLSSVTKKDFIDVLRGKDAGTKVVKAEKETVSLIFMFWCNMHLYIIYITILPNRWHVVTMTRFCQCFRLKGTHEYTVNGRTGVDDRNLLSLR